MSTMSTTCTAMGPARTAPGAGAEKRGLVCRSTGKVVCGSTRSDCVKSLASNRNRSDRSSDASLAVLLGGTSVATYSADGVMGMSAPRRFRSRPSSGGGTGAAEGPGLGGPMFVVAGVRAVFLVCSYSSTLCTRYYFIICTRRVVPVE